MGKDNKENVAKDKENIDWKEFSACSVSRWLVTLINSSESLKSDCKGLFFKAPV